MGWGITESQHRRTDLEDACWMTSVEHEEKWKVAYYIGRGYWKTMLCSVICELLVIDRAKARMTRLWMWWVWGNCGASRGRKATGSWGLGYKP